MLANTLQVRAVIRQALKNTNSVFMGSWTNAGKRKDSLRFVGFRIMPEDLFKVTSEAVRIAEERGFANVFYNTSPVRSSSFGPHYYPSNTYLRCGTFLA